MATTSESISFDIGTDIESIDRFSALTLDKDWRFLSKIFTKKELDYCYSKEDPGPHLAARFAGKEALIKAMSAAGMAIPAFNAIEIINDARGTPQISFNSPSFNNGIKISLSHNKENAIAFVVIMETDTHER